MPLRKHGGKTLVISRFLPLFRTFAPSLRVSAPCPTPSSRCSTWSARQAGSSRCAWRVTGWATCPGQQNLSVLILGIIVVSLIPVAVGCQTPGCGPMRGWPSSALILAAACSTKLGKDGRSDDGRCQIPGQDRGRPHCRYHGLRWLTACCSSPTSSTSATREEWKKAAVSVAKRALDRLRNRHFQRWPEMNGLREGAAAALAFNDAYAGDRVAALVFGC